MFFFFFSLCLNSRLIRIERSCQRNPGKTNFRNIQKFGRLAGSESIGINEKSDWVGCFSSHERRGDKLLKKHKLDKRKGIVDSVKNLERLNSCCGGKINHKTRSTTMSRTLSFKVSMFNVQRLTFNTRIVGINNPASNGALPSFLRLGSCRPWLHLPTQFGPTHVTLSPYLGKSTSCRVWNSGAPLNTWINRRILYYLLRILILIRNQQVQLSYIIILV